ncbi:DNRLRE domain-containing protein [Thermoflexus sp.]|uniref:DNRLRE domain-containing protein n=1 Tax=Thermoflexus sp. TaxID=1969742 RepID=UPI00175655FE|nr:DNRLRE domain-containing protein [Thermoflexus sp.]
MRRSLTGLFLLGWILSVSGGGMPAPAASEAPPTASSTSGGSFRVYLPLVLRSRGLWTSRQVNAPRLADPLGADFPRMAIFWFGKITPTANYADVRVAYTDAELVVYVAIIDRRLWFTPSPSPENLTAWDAVTLLLHVDGNVGDAPSPSAYRFIGGLSNGDASGRYQAAYRGTSSGWTPVSLPFTALAGWRGERLNDDGDDRGWAMTFRIPFASLGRSGPPPEGTIWGLGVMVHDRDDAAGTPIPVTVWPESMRPDVPATWGWLRFGMPAYAPPPARPGGTVIIRHGLNGAVVPDAGVGGYTNCGDGLDYWTQWGEASDPGRPDFNIQNQIDIADWPCFSKYYVIFPLNAIPPGKVILSATLTLHQMGNAGPAPLPSWIQVLTVREDWEERSLTWNRAPLAWENIGGAWVDPVRSLPNWPGIPYTWDVTRAVAEAYAAGQPLRLALYSADAAYHSGKYFVSSDTEDWNAEGRPTLTIVWGDP